MKMKRFLTAVVAFAAMTMAFTGCSGKLDTEAAITNTENVVFTATPSENQIVVEWEDGSKQKLELKIGDDLYDPTMMQVADYNFDGYADILFPYNYNTKNCVNQLWLYQAEQGAFVEFEDFVNYYNPTVDAQTQQITAVYYSDPVTTATSVYEWREGEMLCVAVDIETQDGEGNYVFTKMAYNEETEQLELVEHTTEPIEGYDEIVKQQDE